jgi:hypothetical protein
MQGVPISAEINEAVKRSHDVFPVYTTGHGIAPCAQSVPAQLRSRSAARPRSPFQAAVEAQRAAMQILTAAEFHIVATVISAAAAAQEHQSFPLCHEETTRRQIATIGDLARWGEGTPTAHACAVRRHGTQYAIDHVDPTQTTAARRLYLLTDLAVAGTKAGKAGIVHDTLLIGTPGIPHVGSCILTLAPEAALDRARPGESVRLLAAHRSRSAAHTGTISGTRGAVDWASCCQDIRTFHGPLDDGTQSTVYLPHLDSTICGIQLAKRNSPAMAVRITQTTERVLEGMLSLPASAGGAGLSHAVARERAKNFVAALGGARSER